MKKRQIYNYCTLFDSNYLTRGLALYESLEKHSSDFHLYIFAFDDKSYEVLKKLDLKHATIVHLLEFEDEALLTAKKDRSRAEYCWTCTPSTIKYCIENYKLESCTYLDADLYFFSNPEVLIDEMGEKSVLITEHRYTPRYDQSELSGIYCVQFMTFKNDENGLKVLDWWRNACNEWCYARVEDGKFGDQKYLDDWPTRFRGVHVLENIGGGVAPWNIQQYDVSNKKFQVIFYHFHNLRFLKNGFVDFGGYRLKKRDIELLYKPYLIHLQQIAKKLKTIDSKSDFNGTIDKPFGLRDFLYKSVRILRGGYNVYKIDRIIGQ